VDEIRIEHGPAEVFIIPASVCPVHGRMRQNFAMDQWTCAGFDGEGCDQVVTNEELFRNAKPLGTAGISDLEWQRQSRTRGLCCALLHCCSERGHAMGRPTSTEPPPVPYKPKVEHR
jgi:hypothetical protein